MGPNFINDLEESGKDVNYILDTLSLPAIQGRIQERLKAHGLLSHPFIHTYFVCSDRGQIGESIRGSDKQRLLDKLRNEMGVTVDEIIQSHRKGREMQVDMSVFIRMLEMGPLAIPHDPWRHIVLIASDSDYVPAIRMLSMMGTHTIVVGFRKLGKKKYPIELINESYLFLEMSEILEEVKQAPKG